MEQAQQNNSPAKTWPDIGQTVEPLIKKLIAERDGLRISVENGYGGCTIIDCGAKTVGGVHAGILVAEICMGGMGNVGLVPPPSTSHAPWLVTASSNNPPLACLASQYAGWGLSSYNYYALASGPGRAFARAEELFTELDYRTTYPKPIFILEADRPPPQEIVEKVTKQCGVKPEQLTFILTPTTSLAGGTQIVARCLEVALHKAHELRFPLTAIIDGMGSAPLPPPSPDQITSMGRTNDAIIYGGSVQLFVNSDDNATEQLAQKLVSQSAKDYGTPFATIFERFNRDFYKIDPSLFSPAQVAITNISSGKTFHAGQINDSIIKTSFQNTV